ncbi:DUF1128 domain-containing protein [Aneurinibacillus aneurinilyticus]|uniref:UPF0435 protein HMPREF0083_03382 n=1 Tax=Aneurinibacillus aneurinilyticus ATCC 12856 TaxID=649747 RepID=U1Y8P2_ANEAE|nr:DUF1128 domain-containing protein [Aneurinibacillus aneurinilyticus]ERI08537.1 hypothetical protein HMPREF0083_03382 [Aneurinibacillus aneurinilyticus ATCC 12856]MED0671200.1 DUF1128 domain-containing protein [Aneurinibacillus aneurinilyticus]MED0704995.1 DUF1128 domain-containing protein [Aneurinibacillus aneurinilyticus]MED0721796.1 DUF1128 domain-containing protein [Aneurinibacillus aneurinilyticus]MED0732746.1 DUF1128 domain-containing protein [Aneurinibacillus aneurinilyticus]
MDLSKKTSENIEFMLEGITNKLRMVNVGAIQPSHFDEEKYEDLRDIYDMVMRKDQFSTSELQAIVTELGSLRRG